MKLAHKIFVIAVDCLLVLGVLCLAFGILLGGGITDVITFATDQLSAMVRVLFRPGLL